MTLVGTYWILFAVWLATCVWTAYSEKGLSTEALARRVLFFVLLMSLLALIGWRLFGPPF